MELLSRRTPASLALSQPSKYKATVTILHGGNNSNELVNLENKKQPDLQKHQATVAELQGEFLQRAQVGLVQDQTKSTHKL